MPGRIAHLRGSFATFVKNLPSLPLSTYRRHLRVPRPALLLAHITAARAMTWRRIQAVGLEPLLLTILVLPSHSGSFKSSV